jgi:hypothetical protein
MAVTLKNSILLNVAPCGLNINRRFGGIYRLRLQSRRNNTSSAVDLTQPLPSQYSPSRNFSQSVSCRLTLYLARVTSSTLKMEATCSSETSVSNESTRHHGPEDGIFAVLF